MLDVGCGGGKTLQLLSKMNAYRKIYGIDCIIAEVYKINYHMKNYKTKEDMEQLLSFNNDYPQSGAFLE